MPSRFSRWSFLTLFAIFNLVCWVGAAVTVGMAATDKVDLGVETLVREYRVTAVSIWDQESTYSRPAPTQPPVEAGQPNPDATDVAPGTPRDSVMWPASQVAGSPTSQPPAPGQGSQPVAPTPIVQSAQPTPMTLSIQPTPKPTETPVRSPLLMADPEISNLAAMDAEMQRSAVGRTVQIKYQEAVLNREIAEYVESHPDLPFHSVHVDLKRDRVLVSATAMVLSFPITATAAGTVTAGDCRPQIEVRDISISGVLTPRFVKNQIEDLIHESVDWYPDDYALCIHQIVLEEGRATVYGARR
jgi:hypothetical protein